MTLFRYPYIHEAHKKVRYTIASYVETCHITLKQGMSAFRCPPKPKDISF